MAAGGSRRGESKQDLRTRREPERLRVLREHALIESAVSSNRIEGVVVDQKRVKQVVLGRSRLTDRDEQEVRGYREALNWIHEEHSTIPTSIETILRRTSSARPDRRRRAIQNKR